MTDKEKLDAIRAEIHRLVDVRGYDIEMANDLFAFIDSLPNEPVSDDLEEFALQYAGHHAPYDSCMQEVEDAVKAGALWQKQKDNVPVSEDLIDVAKQYVKEHIIGIDKVTFSIATDMFVSGAKWQKEQMIKNATKVTVHIDASNYPYIPQIELYDYDKDVPLAKEGDKYKVVLIKED